MNPAPEILLVFTNLPDRERAEQLAASLIDGGLAACVNILAPCRSIYQWQGARQAEDEIPVLIKTTRERYPALEAAIRAAHPYELPEIIALPVVAGLPPYLSWVAAQAHAEGAA